MSKLDEILTASQQRNLWDWREIMGKAYGQQHGYKGDNGGWIREPQRGRPVCQGWHKFYRKFYRQIWEQHLAGMPQPKTPLDRWLASLK